MTAQIELFDHTADLGVRVRAATFEELIAGAAAGLYATIGVLAPGADAGVRVFEYDTSEMAVRVRDFLADLLHVFECEGLYARTIAVQQSGPARLVVEAVLAAVDASASQFDREVKAVTYHELALARSAGGFEFTCIVDI